MTDFTLTLDAFLLSDPISTLEEAFSFRAPIHPMFRSCSDTATSLESCNTWLITVALQVLLNYGVHMNCVCSPQKKKRRKETDSHAEKSHLVSQYFFNGRLCLILHARASVRERERERECMCVCLSVCL